MDNEIWGIAMHITAYMVTASVDEQVVVIDAQTKMAEKALGSRSLTIDLSDITGLRSVESTMLSNGKIIIGHGGGRSEIHLLKKHRSDAANFFAELVRLCPKAEEGSDMGSLFSASANARSFHFEEKKADYEEKADERKQVLDAKKADYREKADERKQVLDAKKADCREKADERKQVLDAKKAEYQEKTDARRAVIADERQQISDKAQKGIQDRMATVDGDWRNTVFVGTRPTDKAAATIRSHSSPQEAPWLVIGTLNAGVLAAYEDRLMIIKTGVVTSFMAGTLGGGRITTFGFTDITGIEFNGQLVSGVLEVLTASYQGTANKDYWKGTSSGRNADANDPFTLSNTLPLQKVVYNQALPHLNKLRAMIISSKSPGTTSPLGGGAVPTPLSLGDELTKLSSLFQAGALDEVEFKAAKAALIARLT